MSRFRSMPRTSALIKHLDPLVHGQHDTKRDLCTAVYRHYVSLACREFSEVGRQPFGRRSILLLGPSCSTKTHLVGALAEFLSVPVTLADATLLVETGYAGERIDNVLGRLFIAARGNQEAAQRGIVFIDGIDKLRCQDGNGRETFAERVQTSLLALLDGGSVQVRFRNRAYTMDTSKLLFIFTGAFDELADIIRRRLAAGRTAGFKPTGANGGELTDGAALAHGELQDFREYGMIPELLDRFGVTPTARTLSCDDLVSLMKNAENSPLRHAINWYKVHNLKLVVPNESLTLIADQAVASGTNVRGLERALERLLAPYDWRLCELAEDCYVRVVLTPESVLGRAEPQLELGMCNSADFSAADRLREYAADLLHPPHYLAGSRRPHEETTDLSPGWTPVTDQLAAGLNRRNSRLI